MAIEKREPHGSAGRRRDVEHAAKRAAPGLKARGSGAAQPPMTRVEKRAPRGRESQPGS